MSNMNKAQMRELLLPVLSNAAEDPEAAADALAEKYFSVSELAIADLDELSAIPGLGCAGAYILRLSFALASRKKIDKMRFGKKYAEEDIIEYLKALYLPLSNETVYLLLFDKDGRIISSEFIGEGTVNASGVLPRKLLEAAVKASAAGAIIAHNHPRGYAEASCEDLDITVRIAELFASAGKRIIAHYVISGSEHCKIEVPEQIYG